MFRLALRLLMLALAQRRPAFLHLLEPKHQTLVSLNQKPISELLGLLRIQLSGANLRQTVSYDASIKIAERTG
jgi:hypothetical protein